MGAARRARDRLGWRPPSASRVLGERTARGDDRRPADAAAARQLRARDRRGGRRSPRCSRACPRLDVLVTSRERLRVAGRARVRGPVRSRDRTRASCSSRVRGERDATSRPDERVDELCARLDDLPLAIELARRAHVALDRAAARAARQPARPPQGRPRRRRAAADAPRDDRVVVTSCSTPDEQRLLRRALGLRGRLDARGRRGVCDADLDMLESLATRASSVAGGGALRMLETIREFCAELLRRASGTRCPRGCSSS